MKVFEALRDFFGSKTLFIIFFGTLGLLSLSIAISSLKWTYGLDNQPLLYYAFLSDKFHFLPYRDFFSFNFPAVHLYYYLLVKIFGFSYVGFRIADLLYLFILLTVSFLLFKKISWKVASSTIITFSLIYFIGNNYFSLQRDYVLLLPVTLSIVFIFSFPGRMKNLKPFILGFNCAVAALIKPHAIIIFPLIFVFHLLNNTEEGLLAFSFHRIMKPFLSSMLGGALPVLITLLYLWATNSLKSFFEIQSNFTLLYTSSNIGTINEVSQSSYNSFFENYMKLGGYRPFLLPAIVGFYISIFKSNLNRSQRLLIYLMASLLLFFVIYLAIAGKFFAYHWIPFAYCIMFLSSLCFIEQRKVGHRYSMLINLFTLTIIFTVITIQTVRPETRTPLIQELTGKQRSDPIYLDIVRAADYIKYNLRSGDKVLSLDDVGCGLHSMLLAKAELATYYPLEPAFVFLESVYPNSSYLRNIHIDYMNRFYIAKPRFVIDFSGTKHFVELQTILNSDYIAIQLEHVKIYERKTLQ